MVSCCICDLVMMTWDLDAPMGRRTAVRRLLLWPVNTGAVLLVEMSSLLMGEVVICRRGLLLVAAAGSRGYLRMWRHAAAAGLLRRGAMDLVPIADWL